MNPYPFSCFLRFALGNKHVTQVLCSPGGPLWVEDSPLDL